MLLSVIVPIYNVEKYLKDCIESILKQSFLDFELILIVDGSPDDSYKICDYYAARDKRVKVILKSNGGLVSARKAGANLAQGDYVVSVDGDDFVNQGYFDCISGIITKYNPDIISFNHDEYREKTIKPIKSSLAEGYYSGDSFRGIRSNFIYDKSQKNLRNTGSLSYSICTKVFKNSIYKIAQRNVDDKITIGEDLLCCVNCLDYSDSIFIANSSFYNYRIVNSSMIHEYNPNYCSLFNNVVIAMKSISSIEDRRIAAYSFHALINIIANIARNTTKYSIFKKRIKQTYLYKELYYYIFTIKHWKICLIDRFELFLIKKRLYLPFYLYFRKQKSK